MRFYVSLHHFGRHFIALSGAFAVLHAVSCGEPEAARTVDAAPALPLSANATKTAFVDAAGRNVVLRGVNYSALEFGNFAGQPGGPAELDFVRLASYGVNLVRLPIAWSYLEPKSGMLDETYLAKQVDPVIGWAKRNGMVVVLEMHQYFWSKCTGGIGMPEWLCDGQNYTKDADGSYRAQTAFWAGTKAPDGRTQVAHLEEAWRLVARHYRDETAVLGYDFMNEPMDTSRIARFESEVLYPFYRRCRDIVREFGAEKWLFLEPYVARNLAIRSRPEPIGDARVAFAPHLYTSTGGLPDNVYAATTDGVRIDYDKAREEADEAQAVLWIGEYGGVTDDGRGYRPKTIQGIRDALAEQNRRSIGGALWAYFPGGNEFSMFEPKTGERADVVDAFAQPYLMQIAGETLRLDFDVTTKSFALEVQLRADAADPTVVFVPKSRHYPAGFDVESTGAGQVTWDADTSQLRLWRRAGATTLRVALKAKIAPATP
jgi:endoglycosylceramidase